MLVLLITTILRYSAAKVTSNIYSAPTQANPSSLGKETEIGKHKSIGPDGFPAEILKLGVEPIIPYFARFLDMKMNNGTLPADWKKAIEFPVHEGVIDH
jgi:hypothetical protein